MAAEAGSDSGRQWRRQALTVAGIDGGRRRWIVPT